MAVTSTFNAGQLSVSGDTLDNNVNVSRDAAGVILVNGGAVATVGGTPTVANTSRIQAFGLGGNDTLTLSETNGALPAANLFGGAGNDVLTGGSGGDQLFGEAGNDTLLGRGGFDLLFGGEGNDTLTGGDADDQMFGQGGNDRMIWNPGDDTDLHEGGAGTDTSEVNGGNGAEQFTLTANGTRVRFDRVNPAPFSIDIGTTENIVVNMNGGDDTFDATGNIAALISVTVDGGAGNDTIRGSNGVDLLIGGDGNDFIDGQQGNDTALLGAGDDVFQWDPGDGSDVVEGQDGTDTMLFNGANIGEAFNVFANGGRAFFTRNIANITMDLNDVERIDLRTLGGTDNVVVNDLSATDVGEVVVDLGGDAQLDTVTANATNTADAIVVSSASGTVSVNGLAAITTVENADASDVLRVNGLAGDDIISASTLAAGTISLAASGGDGNDFVTGSLGGDQLFGDAGDDVLLGSGGADVLFGGAGNDVLTGGDGDDQMFGQAGDDRMVWNPGDDSDLMEGGEGNDVAEVNGGNGAEIFTATANGTRVRFDRINPAPFSIDIGTSERVVVNMNGGDDSFSATGNLAALTAFTVDGGAGNDSILGGNGADLLFGGDGNDFIDGQQGNDTALLGAGDDVFQWDPGDGSDLVEGQAGTDTMLFNGSAATEIFNVSANGGRALFTRNLANITMDLNDVERIDLRTLGGADSVVVNDLSATDVTEVVIDLAGATAGTADGAQDQITATGRATADNVTIATSGAETTVTGLPATLRITNADATDALVINTGAGNDNVNASALLATGGALTVDAGAGNDQIQGGAGVDVLRGGAGNDVIDGNRGNDTAFMGDGDDLFVWDPGDGSDVVEGQAGTDTMLFNGSGANESITISANGQRTSFFRDLANVTMDMDGVENITFNALAGADNIVVNDLTGTAADLVTLNLGATAGSQTGDGAADTVTLHGAAAAETIRIGSTTASVQVTGLSADLRLVGAEAASDRLDVRAGAGDDTLDASRLSNNRIQLNLFGEAGNDNIVGSSGADFINGGIGTDTVSMGGGNDRFQWNPGEGSDTIDGQAGFDTHEFNGSAGNEVISLAAGGNDVLLTRNLGNIVMNQDNVERVELFALGGTDNIEIGEMRNTDVREVLVDLTGVAGGTSGDGVQDTVTVNGGSRSEFLTITASGDDLVVNGLANAMRIANTDSSDKVVVRGGGGADVISALSVPSTAAGLALDGGAGSDTLIAGANDTTLLGGAGNDLLIGNAGDDTLNAGSGRDILIGGGGNDLFIGDDDFTILDFSAGAGFGDRIDLRNVAGLDDFGDVVATARGVSGGVVLDFGDDEITLLGVNAAQLNADDFLI